MVVHLFWMLLRDTKMRLWLLRYVDIFINISLVWLLVVVCSNNFYLSCRCQQGVVRCGGLWILEWKLVVVDFQWEVPVRVVWQVFILPLRSKDMQMVVNTAAMPVRLVHKMVTALHARSMQLSTQAAERATMPQPIKSTMIVHT